MEAMIKKHQRQLMSVLPQVKQYVTELDSLTDWWSKVALVGKINSHSLASIILDDMQNTKEKFSELQNKLINNLLLEHLKKVIVDSTKQSQVTIDVLIRNLFERTADVGFLATDEDIRRFLRQAKSDSHARTTIESRLGQYVQKYSVYDEIVILDPQGNVRANLDTCNEISLCKDDLIQRTLASRNDYIETFGYSDLQSKKSKSLIYSCNIRESNDPSSAVLGILCLCFRFDDEMESIFSNLSAGSNSTLLLMDELDQVIASSQPESVAVQTQFAFQETPQLIMFKGKEYLMTSCRSNGYQGFYGLSWWAMVMTPVKSAFYENSEEADPLSHHEDLHASHLFSQALKEIYQASKVVNDDLSLVVLNGQITALKQAAAEFMPVLEAIKAIGESTASIFSASVNELQTTVVSSHMNDAAFVAALAVNIMDRNLYERANDCRWWALTSSFEQMLNKSELAKDEQQHLSDILVYINQLYTVYTNLYLFDNQQRIIAVSNPEQAGLVGQSLDTQSGAAQALKLSDPQKYVVSSFDSSSLYDNKPTYIYNAVISSSDGKQALGGIGIVFDSEPEFLAILKDCLPKNELGEVPAGCFALFAERGGKIVSVTDGSPCCVGEQLSLSPHLFMIEKGSKSSEIYFFEGAQYILGVAASSGYREYKTTGDYENDILAFVFIPI